MTANGAAAQMDPTRLAFVNFMRERRGLPLIGVRAADRYPLTTAWRAENREHVARLERIRIKREIEREAREMNQGASW